jgi:hypothetical protein
VDAESVAGCTEIILLIYYFYYKLLVPYFGLEIPVQFVEIQFSVLILQCI